MVNSDKTNHQESVSSKRHEAGGFIHAITVIALVVPTIVPPVFWLLAQWIVKNNFWSSIITGGVTAIPVVIGMWLMAWDRFYDKLCEFKKHPIYTSFILLMCGVCLLEFCYLTVYPVFMSFSYKISGINQVFTLKAPHFFIDKIGFTPTLSLLLAPYFYVLWIWRHNNTERQATRENIQDNLNHFNSLIGQFSSESEAIQIATAQGMEKFLDNLPDSEPNVEFFYEQAIAIFAEPSLYKDKNCNDMHDKNYYLKVTGILECLQSMYHKVACRNNNPKYAEIRSQIYLFPPQQTKITNGTLGVFGSFRRDIEIFEHCQFEVNYSKSFISEQDSANVQGLCKNIRSEKFIHSLENVDKFIDCTVDLSVAKELDLDNAETRAALEAFIQKVNSFEGLNCPMPEELTNTTEVNSV